MMFGCSHFHRAGLNKLMDEIEVQSCYGNLDIDFPIDTDPIYYYHEAEQSV